MQVAGRVLEPKRAISRNESRDPAAAVSTSKLYVGSIGDLTDQEMKTYFSTFGTIDEIDVQAEKGQAFVTFADHDSVDRIVSQKHTVSHRFLVPHKHQKRTTPRILKISGILYVTEKDI